MNGFFGTSREGGARFRGLAGCEGLWASGTRSMTMSILNERRTNVLGYAIIATVCAGVSIFVAVESAVADKRVKRARRVR